MLRDEVTQHASAWDFLGQLVAKSGHAALLLDIMRNRNALFQ